MWVTGDVMIELITHTNKKIKWVFDETIIHKVGWVERSLTSTLSQESQGQCTMMRSHCSSWIATNARLQQSNQYVFLLEGCNMTCPLGGYNIGFHTSTFSQGIADQLLD